MRVCHFERLGPRHAAWACAIWTISGLLVLSCIGRAKVARADADGPAAAMGIMVGEVTPTSAVAQVRLTATDRPADGDVPGVAGVVQFELTAEGSKAPASETSAAATAEHDFIARAVWDDLEPDTKYTIKTQIGADTDTLRPGPTATFRTHPGPHGARPIRFVVVTGMNYAKFHGDERLNRRRGKARNNASARAYKGPDKQLGYPALDSIRRLQPDFFVGTGDNVYYDSPREGRAQTLTELRKKWHEQFVQPRYLQMFAEVPTYWMIDDHDYRVDDCDNAGDYAPSPELGRRTMLEQLPLAATGDDEAQTYRTHRVSRDLQVWFPENRMHRSPNKTPDGPDKTIWGAAQKAWLKRTLADSDATFKLLVSPTPMIGPDDKRKTDNHTNIGGFQHERDEFFGWLKKTGIAAANFFLVCGDRHWQYHSIHPSGLEEFSCGALVDANSRLGRNPGDPQSTDPKGLIKQPYVQKVASGGFLLVESDPGDDEARPTLKFRFHDEHGKLLHEAVKTAAGAQR